MPFRLAVSLLLGLSAVAAVVQKLRKPKLLYPVANPRITSPFGYRIHPISKLEQFHNGIDLAGTIGTAIAAPADGLVTSITQNDTGGLQMLVKHDNGFTSGFAHLYKTVARVNDRVNVSQLIAYMGNSGKSTGPHLHYTLRDQSGILVNPADYLT